MNTQKELNPRQRRWLELLKDYDTNVLYTPSRANIVADALCLKTMDSVPILTKTRRTYQRKFIGCLC